MNRYEVRQISPGWWGIWDNIRQKYVVETTRKGIEVYAEIMGLEA